MIVIMSDDFFQTLLQMHGVRRSYPAGGVLFRIGDPVLSIHFVIAGQVNLMRTHENGSALILQRTRAGGILAEASLHSAIYHCDAIAAEDAVTWSVAVEALQRRLASEPDFSAAWLRHLAHEVQRVRMQAEILSMKTVKARLDAWIAWNGSLPDKGRWAAIAREIGVSPEALYREISSRQH